MKRFLLAAAALSVFSSARAEDWVPTSPLIQIGDDIDIFFDSSVALEVTNNLFSTANAKSATDWTVTPGLAFEYGKDSPVAFTLNAKRSYVYFFQSQYRNLQDSRDSLSGDLRLTPGGPLTVVIDSSYRVTARNDDLAAQGVDLNVLGATLVRQSNYSHSISIDYVWTEKMKSNVSFINTYNHYLNPVTFINTDTTSSPGNTIVTTGYNTAGLTELNTKALPVSLTYQAFEKISFGLKFEHDQTDYSYAPYFKEVATYPTGSTPTAPVISSPNPLPTALLKDFYGLTVNGQPTSSGKLNVTGQVGYSSYSGGSMDSASVPSYSLTLTHNLTDLITHSLSVGRDVSASSTGGRTDSKTYNYNVSYTAATDLTLTTGITYLDATSDSYTAGVVQVKSTVYSIGAEYKYNPHLTFNAGFNYTDLKIPAAPQNGFTAQVFNLSASFRY
jgi:outer membrane receptor protein involved in Fe transport